MIKVTIGESKTQEVKEFPKLMKCKNDGTLFFFIEAKIGLPLQQKYSEDYLPLWASSWVMERFEDFNEPITIQNQ